MTDLPREVPVLIVGGGPVGLGLAADLGWRGIPCLLVEQSDGTIYHPRANTVNSRTMEFCRRWGVADKVRNSGAPADFPQDIIYLTSLKGYEIARIKRPTHGGNTPLPTTPERSQRCNQLYFDPILRDLVASLAPVTLRYRCRFESFVEAGDGILATVRDVAADRALTIKARHLVLCCGGGSPIPQSLGVRMEGIPVLSYHLNVFLRISALWERHDKGKAAFYMFVSPQENNPTLIELDGDTLWRLGINRGLDPNPLSPGDIDAVVRKLIGADIPYEVISALPWTCRSIVADRWRVGAAVLAGDAVHQHGPAGGFGMNTGMGDAVDLGWKLAALAGGWGGAGLLASYESERRPVAKRNVDEATENMNRSVDAAAFAAIAKPTAAGETARSTMRAAILRDKTKQFISDGIALGYRYDPSPIICPDGSPPPPESTMDYVQTSRPGSRAPHAFLAPGRSTLDLFGRGFVLMSFDGAGGEAAGLERAAASRGVPLQIAAIDDPGIAALYERRLVLVRPDGHVAWRGDRTPADPLAVIDVARGAGSASKISG